MHSRPPVGKMESCDLPASSPQALMRVSDDPAELGRTARHPASMWRPPLTRRFAEERWIVTYLIGGLLRGSRRPARARSPVAFSWQP